MAQTEVTYQLWSTVKTWATTNGYTFSNQGTCGAYIAGSDSNGYSIIEHYTSGPETQPVTNISWRDAVVWCNALTEYYNAQNGTSLDCVYTSGGTPIRDSTNNTSVIDNLTDDGHTATGFRLPTSMEWELAARYIGSTKPTVAPLSNEVIQINLYWTPGDYASGATANYQNTNATYAVSWNFDNSGESTKPVGNLAANVLEIHDMSGNVWGYCFDQVSSERKLIRGGGVFSSNEALAISPTGQGYDTLPSDISDSTGLRPVRTK